MWEIAPRLEGLDLVRMPGSPSLRDGARAKQAADGYRGGPAFGDAALNFNL
jgi:hypothetical protein